LFAYKDQRFGCLSRAAGVLLFYFDTLTSFLVLNTQITNRLSCLVRELLGFSYLKPVLAVFAAYGLQLIEPFYATTISTESTHTALKSFYKSLYASMENPLTIQFFRFDEPAFGGISVELFKQVKESYGMSVIEAVIQVANEFQEETLAFANLVRPELRTVLARQRRDYGLDEQQFPAEYPIEQQASKIDDTPVNDMAMIRPLGKTE